MLGQLRKRSNNNGNLFNKIFSKIIYFLQKKIGFFLLNNRIYFIFYHFSEDFFIKKKISTEKNKILC